MDSQDREIKKQEFTLYTVQRVRKDDTLYGKVHGSNTADYTLCGLKTNIDWSITNNTFDGVITCKECINLLREKGYAAFLLP